mmetsp:Transcript_2859/g.2685  ORF Transcript_2859/g.2685 Transcript_2859/m.2685 type:complete len:100 (-) Transcript_2859:359-658(-)
MTLCVAFSFRCSCWRPSHSRWGSYPRTLDIEFLGSISGLPTRISAIDLLLFFLLLWRSLLLVVLAGLSDGFLAALLQFLPLSFFLVNEVLDSFHVYPHF